MKRNEMVLKIKEFLKGYEDSGFEEEREDDADALLSMIENNGMRPPTLLDQRYNGPLEGWVPEEYDDPNFRFDYTYKMGVKIK